MTEYQITVTVRLPKSLDCSPLDVLSSIVLSALHDSDVEVRYVSTAVVAGSEDPR